MICAIIPAAGQSRRMGTQKVLLPFAGQTVIGHIVDQILRSPVAETVVVVRPGVPRLAAALAGRRVTLVPNPDAGGDMLSSVRRGVRALPPDCEAVLVALGDQPSVTAGLVTCMIEAFRTSGRGIVVPVYGGRPGHPILFSARYCEEVLTRHDGVGLCGLRQAHSEDVFEMSVADPSVLIDVDHPEDYRRALAEFHAGPSPDETTC
jgi:molybdenum cofactor cytidylyltransferase